MAVLIITNEQDLGADYVVLEMERRGVPGLRCNAERLPTWRVSLRPGHDWELHDPHGRTARSGETSGVWWRRPERPVFAANLSPGEQQALVDQWQAFAEGLASVYGPVWVSPPAAIAAAEDKAAQLTAARRVGFAIPETLWTNDIVQARELVSSGAAVVKTVTAAHWEEKEEAAFVFAHEVEPRRPTRRRRWLRSRACRFPATHRAQARRPRHRRRRQRSRCGDDHRRTRLAPRAGNSLETA